MNAVVLAGSLAWAIWPLVVLAFSPVVIEGGPNEGHGFILVRAGTGTIEELKYTNNFEALTFKFANQEFLFRCDSLKLWRLFYNKTEMGRIERRFSRLSLMNFSVAT